MPTAVFNMTNLSRSQKRDPHEAMAELFNSLDRSTEEAMLTALDNRAPDSAERIRALMFTFEDLSNLLPAAISIIVRNADKREMAMALKGAPDKLKQMFFGAMTERAAKLMREDMKQLFIGGEGTLGIITAAVLRLFSKPTASETAWIGIASPQEGVALLGHMAPPAA